MSNRLFQLLELLDSQDVRARINQMIQELGGVDDADAETIMKSMDARLRGIAASLRDVVFDDDITEAQSMLPWVWLELRFEWMRYNMQMQYQTVMQGTASPALMARGAALSYVLEAVELHLDAESAFLVQKVAADPAAAARGGIERTDRLFELMASASAGGRDAVESLFAAQAQIGRHTDSTAVHQEVSKVIGTVMEKIGGALQVSVVDFSHAIEGVLIRQLGRAPVRVALTQISPDVNAYIPSAVANALLATAGEWMRAIGETSLNTDAEARIAAGRPAHVTLTASLQLQGQFASLVLSDDADGTVLYQPNWREWPVRDLKLQLVQREGEGGTLTVQGLLSDVAEYLMVRVGEDEHDAVIGVPLLAVDHIEQREESALGMWGGLLIDRQSETTTRLIDLGETLFGTGIPQSVATYVLVRPDGPEAPALALRVRGVEGICRGSVKQMPTVLTNSPLRGFVQADQHLVSIIDFDRLLGREQRDGMLQTKAA